MAPRDIPAPGKTEALIELFETCSVPSPFIDESLRDVSQSFAACEDVNDTLCIWFHLLCKTLIEGRGKGAVYDSEAKTQKAAKARSEADFSWIKPGIVMKIRKQPKTTPKPVRTSTSNSDDTLVDAPVKPKVELVCFGAPNTLHDRLRTIAVATTCDELLDDPYMLLAIIFEDMFKILDCTAWAVADKFGRLETVRTITHGFAIVLTNCQKTLEIASMPGKASEELPTDLFTALHNLAKHAIYLRENCEEALATLKDLSDHHKAATGEDPNASQKRTRQALEYRKTLFESTQRRLASLNARISNIIQLSFHIVTQGDSKVMQSENQSMKTIAVMTLVFMPLGTVASIFGSQFMELQEEQPHHITVSRDFWLMWIIAVPLTVIVWTSKYNPDTNYIGSIR